MQALLAGERDPEQLVELAKGRLRNKKAELALALEGRLRPHHARLLTRILAHLEFLAESIAECEVEIDKWCRPFEQEIALLDTTPGVDKRAAQDLIAETGVEMRHFASHKRFCSWAKISPGNNESGGKRHSGRTGKGNKWLRSILVECAHAAGRSKDTYLGSQFRRFAGRKGTKRAAVVVTHSILESAYFILRAKVPYQDLGADYLAETKKAHAIRYHVRQLESLGLNVMIQELPLAT